MGGVQERLVVGISRFGDRLLKAHVAADRVAVLAEHGIGEQAGHSPVTVLEGVDDEDVEDEQPGPGALDGARPPRPRSCSAR